MKIALVMPRRMTFSDDGATSIDLCVRDFVLHSRFQKTTTVYCAPVAKPFAGITSVFFSKQTKLIEALRVQQPQVIVVEQFLPLAKKLRRLFPATPILLHVHNYQKKSPNIFKRWLKTRFYNSVAGIIFVSNDCRDDFLKKFPNATLPTFVAHNGLNLSEWQPQSARAKTILFTGRLAEEKGVFEAAAAMASLLPRYPDWKARFIVSTMDKHPGFAARLEALLQPVASQSIIDYDCPFATVRAAMEEASIVLVPSKWNEPFGRTAIEAFAGGAALIATPNGGLREVIGSAALVLQAVEPNLIAATVGDLIERPDYREQLAKAGFERVAGQFTLDRNASVIDGAIARVTANAEPQRRA